MKERLSEVQEIIRKLSEENPNLLGPFLVFNRKATENGAIDIKTKRLITVALAVARQCEWCIAHHTKRALEAGVTKAELVEACALAILMAGAPAMMHTQLVLKTIDELTKQL
ncbi:carboxymuconolactone decarboxylase family protein [Candidatus Bathyarchaeota archaeon]|nr:carboxymuconolactone decarboxylase family protein [Candidatus Bathyarchaeota archaeon]